MKTNTLILISLFLAPLTGYGQHNVPKVKDYDLSTIWTSEGPTDVDETDYFSTKRPAFLGFIGDNYQRIFIQINEVVQDHLNPLIYFVRGSSQVNDNTCTFIGTITIDSAVVSKRAPIFEGADYLVDMTKVSHVGTAYASYQLFENKNQKWTGYFSGQLQTQFYITTDNQIKYDAIRGFSDRFINNAYTGIWTSYASGKAKICNWGEYRIPNSGDLDIGAGAFSPNPKYIDNGWRE